MAIGGFTFGTYKNVTGSGNVSAKPCAIIGILVNSTSSGTITLYDDPATGTATAITGTITPSVGFLPINIETTSGLNIVIGATINITVVYAISRGF